jgi:RimJ/RimL family protein N-acetyltransferase
MTNPFLVGSRIYLRPLERDDAPRLTPWFNDPELRQHIQSYWPRSVAWEEQRIANAGNSSSDVLLGIALKESDALVGVTGLHDLELKDRHAQLGISLGDKAAWGQGLGGEAVALMLGFAFGTLNLHRVWLHVYPRNARAVRCYEKAGFKKEGLLRQHHFFDGEYEDVLTMAVLRGEWRSGK